MRCVHSSMRVVFISSSEVVPAIRGSSRTFLRKLRSFWASGLVVNIFSRQLFTCHTCHMSHVTCHTCHTCHMSHPDDVGGLDSSCASHSLQEIGIIIFPGTRGPSQLGDAWRLKQNKKGRNYAETNGQVAASHPDATWLLG